MNAPAFRGPATGWTAPENGCGKVALLPRAATLPSTAIPALAEAEYLVPRRARSLRRWWIERRLRRSIRRSIEQVPEHLRQDVGLDGGLPLARFENGGRTFISAARWPDSTLSSWFW